MKVSVCRWVPLLFIFLTTGCFVLGNPAKERDFELADLFLPIGEFPDGWKEVGTIRPMGPNSAIGVGDSDDVYQRYNTQRARNNVGGYYVYWNASTGLAASQFNRLPQLGPNNSEPWDTPDALSYRSPYADRFYAACGPRACRMIAQYEEFVVEFLSGIGPDTMSVEEFNTMVCKIDARFVERLSLSDEPVLCDNAT